MPKLAARVHTRYQRFARAYASTLNATKSAIEAGYSVRSAGAIASALMQKVNVQALIASELDAIGITRERTVREIARIAYANHRDLYDAHGNLKAVQNLPESVSATIARTKVIKRNLVAGDGEMDIVYEVKQWDKVKALEMAAKFHGLLEDRVEHDVQIQVSWVGEQGQPINITPEKPQHLVSECTNNETSPVSGSESVKS